MQIMRAEVIGRSALRLAYVLVLSLGACSSDAGERLALLQRCTLASDCNQGLICALGSCRKPCKESRDCGNGGSCLSDGVTAVCQVLEEKDKSCYRQRDCPAPLACAGDYRCRNLCESDDDCNVLGIRGRSCAEDEYGVSYCAEPAEASDGMLSTQPPAGTVILAGGPDTQGRGADPLGPDTSSDMDASSIGANDDAGAGGRADGGSGPADGSAALGDGGGGLDGGAIPEGGGCAIRFSAIAVGDRDPGFLGAVGSRTADGLLILNSVSAPETDGGANVSQIYAQAFDLAGVSQGPAARVFVTSTGAGGPYLMAAATAPDGSTMILYFETNWVLMGALLTPERVLARAPFIVRTSGGGTYAQPDLQWVRDRFVVGWVYGDSGMYSMGIAMFATDGSRVGGITPVPTDHANAHVSQGAMSVAASNNVIGVAYRSGVTNAPMLTRLDLDATPIGAPLAIANVPSAYGLALGGTNQGFAYLWHEGAPSAVDAGPPAPGLFGDKTLHASFVSAAGTLGATTRVPGSTEAIAIRGSSNGTGAGFAMLYGNEGLRFGYATGDLKGGLRVASALPGGGTPSISSFGDSFGLFLPDWSGQFTRGVAEGCNLSTPTP